MDANDIRGRAKFLHADTIHMETGEDGRDVIKAAIYKGWSLVYSFPEDYDPLEFPEYTAAESKQLSLKGPRPEDAWRHV